MGIRKRSRGFTIVELMVVVTILFILSTFLIPRVIGYQNKAKTAKAIYTGRQIQTVILSSFAEQGGIMKEEEIKSSTKDILGIELKSLAISSEGQYATAEYNSDGKKYTLEVDGAANSYRVKEGSKQLFDYGE